MRRDHDLADPMIVVQVHRALRLRRHQEVTGHVRDGKRRRGAVESLWALDDAGDAVLGGEHRVRGEERARARRKSRAGTFPQDEHRAGIAGVRVAANDTLTGGGDGLVGVLTASAIGAAEGHHEKYKNRRQRATEHRRPRARQAPTTNWTRGTGLRGRPVPGSPSSPYCHHRRGTDTSVVGGFPPGLGAHRGCATGNKSLPSWRS